ncbi:MAG: hypothetical protein IKD20_02835 [Clostridia bacterium]|nr:hypothetical protein [Clostridia bacterium]
MIKKILVLRSIDGKSAVGTVRISVDRECSIEYSPKVEGAKCYLVVSGKIVEDTTSIDSLDDVVAMVVAEDKILYTSTTSMSLSTLSKIYEEHKSKEVHNVDSQEIDESISVIDSDNDTTKICEDEHVKNSKTTIPLQSEPLAFYYKVRDALEETFVCYPLDDTLSKVIEGSEWVRIESGGSYYVVGKVYMEGVLKYICYGLPGDRSMSPPDELANHTQYIPIPDTKGGYFVIFQDANTGELLSNCD